MNSLYSTQKIVYLFIAYRNYLFEKNISFQQDLNGKAEGVAEFRGLLIEHLH